MVLSNFSLTKSSVAKKARGSKRDPRVYAPASKYTECTFVPEFPSIPLDDNIPGMYLWRKHEELSKIDDEGTDVEVSAITSNSKKCIGARRKLTYDEEELATPEVISETEVSESDYSEDIDKSNGADLEDEHMILKLIDNKNSILDKYCDTGLSKYKSLADAYALVIKHLNN